MIICLVKTTYSRITYNLAMRGLKDVIQKRSLNLSCQVEELRHRGLVRVSGKDAANFLQGIVTNDLNHLQGNSKSLFAMFLNTKGRVLYDTIIYKSREPDTYLIECDCNSLPDLIKHIKMFRVRKKIQVDAIDQDWKLWVLFNPTEVKITNSEAITINQEVVVPCTFLNSKHEGGARFLSEIILSENASVYSDPRMVFLGNRVIVPANENVEELVRNARLHIEARAPCTYRMLRYRLGVGEGVEELPVGKCFPLEVNCDYLHGVSFHKGCYIGQELTARTHHTGVVRKRLMPILLHSDVVDEKLPLDTPIEAVKGDKKTVIGKLRGLEKNSGIGLMRVTEALEINKCTIGSVVCETIRPSWWPQELPKDRLDSKRS